MSAWLEIGVRTLGVRCRVPPPSTLGLPAVELKPSPQRADKGRKGSAMTSRLGQLPVPPARLCQVVQATRDPDIPMGKIVRLISSDPGLTVELLRIANSAYYSPRQRIRTVGQAAVFLGLRSVRHHAVSHVLKSVIDQIDLAGIDQRRLWRDIVYRGAAAHVLAELASYPDPTEAFTTGVILDAGFVMLLASAPEHAAALDAASQLAEERRLAIETELCGTTHPEIFAACARQWGLPEELVRPIEAHHDPAATLSGARDQKLLQIARLADLLLPARSGDTQAVGAFLEARRSIPGMPRPALADLFDHIERELPRLADLVNPPKAPRKAEILHEAVQAMTAINDEYRVDNQALRQQNQALDRAASEDPLTGVANRRAFTRHLDEALQTGSVSLVMFDLDHFKQVNDTMGHDIGDDVLVGVCRRVEEVLGANELLGRLGGEEFAVLVPSGEASAQSRAEALRAHLAASPIACRGGVEVAVTGSFGGVSGSAAPDRLYKLADQAMYDSKRSGRNQVQWSGDPNVTSSVGTGG